MPRVSAGADALVTGDQDLLDLAGTVATPILSPESMKRHLDAAVRHATT